jgi:hypothetical protein
MNVAKGALSGCHADHTGSSTPGPKWSIVNYTAKSAFSVAGSMADVMVWSMCLHPAS